MQLNYKQYGTQGEDIIILHGLFGMLDNWATVGGKLGESFKVWLIDQRNHGKSPHSAVFDYDVMAADLADFMKAHSITKAHIIGHSMGGKTAMQFAFSHPEKIISLIVVDIAPKGYGAHHDLIIDALQSLQLDKITRRPEAEEKLAEKIKEDSVRQFLLKNLSRDASGYHWKMDLPDIVANYDKIIGPVSPEGHFDGRTLFISGGNSDYIEDSDIPSIRRQFPAASFITFPGIGHWVHAEAPKEFEQTVREFLS